VSPRTRMAPWMLAPYFLMGWVLGASARNQTVQFPEHLDRCAVAVDGQVVETDSFRHAAVVRVTEALRGGALTNDLLVVLAPRDGLESFAAMLLKGTRAILGVDSRGEVIWVGFSEPEDPALTAVRVPRDSALSYYVSPDARSSCRKVPGENVVLADRDYLRQLLADPLEIALNCDRLLVREDDGGESKRLTLSVTIRPKGQGTVSVDLGTNKQPTVTAALKFRHLVGRLRPVQGAGPGELLLHASASYAPDDVLRAVKGDPSILVVPMTEVPSGEDTACEQPISLAAALGSQVVTDNSTADLRLVVGPNGVQFALPIGEDVLRFYHRTAVTPLVGVSFVLRPSEWRLGKDSPLRGWVASPAAVLGVLRE
jgi:hypothetical protein